MPSPVYATVSWRRSPATIVPSETSRRLRRCQSPLRLLVFSNRQPERWFGRRRLEQRRKNRGKNPPICCGVQRDDEPRTVRKKGWRWADEDGRGDGGGDLLSRVLFVVFCRVYEPFSPPPSRLSGSLPPDAAPLFSPPRCALCDALSAPAKIRSPPAFSPLLPLFHHPHVSLDSDRLQKRGGGGAIRMRGASFRKQKQRRRSPGRRTLLPAILLSGVYHKEGGYTKNMSGVPVGSACADAFRGELLLLFLSCLL